MQATIQTPGGAASDFFSWTVIMLILMAVGAAVVVAGMIYGSRLARQRHRAQDAAEERAEEAGVEPTDPDAPVEETSEPQPKRPESPDREKETGGVLPKPEPKIKPEAKQDIDGQPAAPPPPSSAPAAAIEPAIAGALALTTIKGLGPKVAALLAERGVTRVDQLAALDDSAAAALDVQLGSFTGRMARDRWIDQARLLASGDTAAYEAEFGKLG